MYKITLEDGTELKDLELNGNNFIANTVIEDEVFEDNLGKITITDEEGNIEEQKDMKLVANRVIDGKSWFILAEKTRADKEREEFAKVTEITTRQMVKEEKLSEEELLFLVNLYPKYRVGKEYKEGDIFNYQGKLYEVLQNHTSQEDWKPDEAGSLYVSRMPEGVIPEWQQPTGAHDAYNTGDKVTYGGQVWTSLIDGNTAVPDGDEPYNRYWEPES